MSCGDTMGVVMRLSCGNINGCGLVCCVGVLWVWSSGCQSMGCHGCGLVSIVCGGIPWVWWVSCDKQV